MILILNCDTKKGRKIIGFNFQYIVKQQYSADFKMKSQQKSQTLKKKQSNNDNNNAQVALLEVLTTLTQKLSSSQNNPSITKQQIVIKLLQKIDESYFEYKFAPQQTYDYEAITKSIVDYYNEKRLQKIKKIFVITSNYTYKFQHIFQLVLDLAMNSNQCEKQRYIEEIINMSDREKQILMPYVDEVTKRKFISNLNEFHKYVDTHQIQHSQEDQLLEVKDQQYQQLREHYQDLSRMHSQLIQNHNNLKASFQKILNQNSIIIHEKYQLMNQLGVHPSSTFLEIAEKYKSVIKQYEGELQRLNKDIQDKNNRLQNKENQIKQLSGSVKKIDLWEIEKNQLMNINKSLEKQLKVLQTKEIKTRDELQAAKITISKLKQELQEKQQQISVLAKTKMKYKGLKQAHLQFKKNFIEKMKGG